MFCLISNINDLNSNLLLGFSSANNVQSLNVSNNIQFNNTKFKHWNQRIGKIIQQHGHYDNWAPIWIPKNIKV